MTLSTKLFVDKLEVQAATVCCTAIFYRKFNLIFSEKGIQDIKKPDFPIVTGYE